MPVASWLQTAALLPPVESATVVSDHCGSDPELSRPEIWFDWSFSRLACDSASPPFAEALPPLEPAFESSPTLCAGPPVPPVALPPAPPVVVVVCVLVAEFVWWHWSLPCVLPVASCLQTSELLLLSPT